MNQSEFAKLHGVSRKTVTTWKARGWLLLDGDEIDVDASNAMIERYRKTVTPDEKKLAAGSQGNKKGNTAGNKRGNTGKGNKSRDESPAAIAERMIAESGATMTRDEALTMKENYFALHAQLDYDVKAGKLLPWQDMVDEVAQEYARMRTRLIALAPEHGPRLRALASTTDDTEFVAALQELIYEALNELAIDSKDGPATTVQ
ncbi:RNA polymerase subunit sigma-70 [Enterobacter cancerogenus]|uniref:RNA polymerase subunit sigma-70 n=1 Tax=Enterobacter cancerogenus TaxID=69218 RepID=UPI00384C00A5